MASRKSKERSRSKPPEQIKIAKERIEILFEEASKMVKEDKKLANRYVQLARKIGMRYNVKISHEFRRKMCRKCKSYLYSGITSVQRVGGGFLRIKCLACGRINRYPIKSKR